MQALTIALLISLCGLLIWFFLRRQQANNTSDEWDIREATFLYQTRGLSADPCYLEVTYVSPPKVNNTTSSKAFAPPPPPATSPPPVEIPLPDEFMKRIAEKIPNLKRSSECEAITDGIVDKKTGQKGGYIFTVSNILWISPTEVEVSGGLRVGTTVGTSKTYYLKKDGAKWQVVGEHLNSISGD